MNDTIYRQAVIDKLADVQGHAETKTELKVISKVWQEVKKMPSVQKTGQWLEDKTGCVYWICSCCGYPSEASCANIFYRFCPRCGARMEGVE